MIKIKGGMLPGSGGDALAARAEEFLKDPRRKRVALVVFDTEGETTSFAAETQDVKLRLLRVEIIEGEDAQVAEKLIRRALEKRSGGTTLPYDLEEEVRSVFEESPPPPPGQPPLDEAGGP